MKKVIRMLGLCALIALAFTACKKNDTNGKVTIKASISQPTSNDRTYITDLGSMGDKVLRWRGNEVITLFNRTLTGDSGCNIQVTSCNNKYAYFLTSDPYLEGISTPNRFIAFYPNAAINLDNKVELAIPNQQPYDEYWIANDIFPMYGFIAEDYNIEFKSHAGVLMFTARLNNDTYNTPGTVIPLQKIIITGFDNPSTGDEDVLYGTMVYDLDGNYTMTNTGNVVEITGGELKNGNTVTQFYAILPEGALANGFTAEFITTDGDSVTYQGGGQAIVAERVTEIRPTLNVSFE